MLDPVQNHWWIAPASLVLLFAVRAVIVAVWGRRLQGDTIYFLLLNLVLVPSAVYLTLWCYAHPDQIAADPNGSAYDMRVFWPYFALFYIGFATWYGHGVMRRRAWWRWSDKGLALIEQAKRLEAEGRLEEAEAAYAKWRWIFDHKVRYLP